MSNFNIHTVINLNSKTHEEIDWDHMAERGIVLNQKEVHQMSMEDIEQPDFTFDAYMRAMTGMKQDDRSMTKEEYKEAVHSVRYHDWHQSREDNCPHGGGYDYEPELNPGGGPYNHADCI